MFKKIAVRLLAMFAAWLSLDSILDGSGKTLVVLDDKNRKAVPLHHRSVAWHIWSARPWRDRGDDVAVEPAEDVDGVEDGSTISDIVSSLGQFAPGIDSRAEAEADLRGWYDFLEQMFAEYREAVDPTIRDVQSSVNRDVLLSYGIDLNSDQSLASYMTACLMMQRTLLNLAGSPFPVDPVSVISNHAMAVREVFRSYQSSAALDEIMRSDDEDPQGA